MLYNIDWDPSELHPVSTKNENYAPIMAYLTQKRTEALANMKNVTNQMLLGGNSDYEICGDPDSQSKYPQYPLSACVARWKRWMYRLVIQ